jgi:mannose-binding lectin 2
MIKVCLLLAFLGVSLATILDPASFKPPFDDVDVSGGRVVNEYWRSSGTAEVMKNFVRLTPDRQSKRGSLWMKQKLASPNIVTTVKFRISGQGKNFYGDGVGVWFTDSAFWSEGDLHGGQANFKGVAIIFDTFKNTESLSNHRDVTVLVNDGQKSIELMKEDVQGCNTNPAARYHNERADFQATDASRALITIQGNKLSIQVDARNNGEWQECVDQYEIPELAVDWLTNSYMGITASTGQLGDNHDIISVSTDTDTRRGAAVVSAEKRIVEGGAKVLPGARLFPQNPNGPVEARLLKIENAINDILKSMADVDLEMEHFGVDTEEKLKNIIGKLSKREDEAERRLEVIEGIVRDQVEHHVVSHIEDRLADHEAGIKADLQETVNDIADHIDRQVDSMEKHKDDTASYVRDAAETLAGNLDGAGGSWKMPFYFLLVVVLASVGAGFHYFQQFKKKHFL